MSNSDATRFFDTSGCLNLSRPASSTQIISVKQRKRPVNSSIPIKGQVKIDLFNFDHIDFADSKYVLTSPRSLEACARLNIKPTALLPTKLANITSDKVKFSTLVNVSDELEIDRLAKLQCCREEREKIIREKSLTKPPATKAVDSKLSNVSQRLSSGQTSSITKFSPSRTLPHDPREFSDLDTKPSHFHSTSIEKSSQKDTYCHFPPKPASYTRSFAASSVSKISDDQNELRRSSSGNLLDDVRRMDQNLQRISTSALNNNQGYVNGLENVKQLIQQHVAQTTLSDNEENLTLETSQYDLLLSHYDNELKLHKARENARQVQKEKEAGRYESLMHDFLDQTMAEERRQNELRRKIDKLHQSRQLYEALQAKNQEVQIADVQKRRLELLNEIKRKDRRTQHFIKDKKDTASLSRILAKSSQDTREYIRETKESFDQKARKAELESAILVTKPKTSTDRRQLQSSIRT